MLQAWVLRLFMVRQKRKSTFCVFIHIAYIIFWLSSLTPTISNFCSSNQDKFVKTEYLTQLCPAKKSLSPVFQSNHTACSANTWHRAWSLGWCQTAGQTKWVEYYIACLIHNTQFRANLSFMGFLAVCEAVCRKQDLIERGFGHKLFAWGFFACLGLETQILNL